jgi:hypothetical protein
MTKLDNIMDKIKKLLALSGNNPSEEATSAALKAQELMAKYNITLTEEEKEIQEIAQESFRTGVDKSWKHGLASVVSDNFRVMCFWTNNRTVTFYGYKQDVEIAVRVYEYLFKVAEKGARVECRKAYKLRGTETGVYFSYTRGFTAGVKEALEVQCTALMIVTPQEVKDSFSTYTEERGMKTMGKYRNGAENGTSRQAFESGKNDGRTAANSRQIDNKEVS